MINQPIYCVTSDIDWASSHCIEDFMTLVDAFGITPTLFATHDNPLIKRFSETNPNDIGVHPNFGANSTHGKDHNSVIDHVFSIYPNAKTFRSHSFYDSSDILHEMSKRGVRYDSNLCLYLQPNIVPLQLGVRGITRFPVFWEDDSHWMHTAGDWQLCSYVDAFTSPGLKIINVHPFIISANIPSGDYYLSVKEHITTLSEQDLKRIRYNGPGARTFFIDFIKFVKSQNQRFHTLNELFLMFPIKSFLSDQDETKGRTTAHSDVDYQKYWQMSDAEKQDLIKKSFEQREAKDKYATSRDYHARELEIQAIGSGVSEKGVILDLGCGNGYTLLSLAKQLKDWKLIGIDFSENLIEGAKSLVAEENDRLQSQPEFICADAISYISSLEDDSVKYVISERLIQNLPSIEWQKNVIRHIYRILERGGRYLMCEGSQKGFRALNDLRGKIGLSIIPETSTENISALRINDDHFENYLQSELGFKLRQKLGFSQYFIISRVLHPLLVAPLRPRFDSRINDLARMIQENIDFRPGYGSNVLWVLEK
jgi:ubiquinone/menaquinone biosynthesis C-methylase UbiE